MKLIDALVATALVFSAGVAPVSPASAEQTTNNGANAELHEFCQDLIASGYYPTANYGECISFNSTSESGFKAHFCDFLRESDAYADWGFTSYSDCIRNLPF